MLDLGYPLQVAKLQRMKKSANWLDDICKLLQDNDLALSYTPKVQTVLQTRLF